MRRVLVAAVAVALSGCAALKPLGKEFRKPTPELPAQFGSLGATATAEKPLPAFWTAFNDPVLEGLVRDAWRANFDLAAATERLAEARGLRNEQWYDFVPRVTGDASRTTSNLSEIDSFPGVPAERTVWQAGFDARWEIDLFGRLRGTARARAAELRSAKADLDAVRVAVAAEVARTYFELRGAAARLAVAQQNAATQASALELVQQRLDAGRGTGLDVARARAQLATTRAAVPLFEVQAVRARLRLAVLLGETPGTGQAAALGAGPAPTPPAIIAAGSPTEWLRRRPDIRAAEGRLAAATARTGVAIADLFPTVSFGGNYAWRSLTRDTLGDPGTDSYQYGPSLTWPAIGIGRLVLRLGQSRSRARQALASYKQVVLTALEETEGALTAYDRLLARQRDLDEAAAASGEAARLARLRFTEGYADFLTVLDAERVKLEAEDRAEQGHTEAATAAVAAYKALGAGWEAAESGPYAPAK